jgi:MFS family permease
MATESNAEVAVSRDSSPYPSSFAAWYSVAVLMLMYIFSFIDRTTISLLVEPMKRDLHISDTQIGMLQGLAFALLYTFLGLPIARLSDRHSRRAIIAGGVFIWSIMATLCGLARSAVQLFMARIGVGVGEAALSPAAYSIITDSFPRSKLGGAFSVYNVGITIGAGTALLVGGIVVGVVSRAGATYTLPVFGPVHAWQMVFILTGAPGMLLAGVLCDRLTKRGWKDAPIVVAAISASGIAVLSSFPPFMPTVPLVWVALFISGITFNAYNGVGPMAVNQVTPNQYRAQISAVYLFVVNALGLGVGPTLVPFINEHVFHDPVKIRYSMVLVVFCSAVVALILLLKVRPIYRQKQIEAASWQ